MFSYLLYTLSGEDTSLEKKVRHYVTTRAGGNFRHIAHPTAEAATAHFIATEQVALAATVSWRAAATIVPGPEERQHGNRNYEGEHTPLQRHTLGANEETSSKRLKEA